jgi:hypothetical protein
LIYESSDEDNGTDGGEGSVTEEYNGSEVDSESDEDDYW